MMPGLFFGVGTGRCGTMWLTNLLNSEEGVFALHEGNSINESDKVKQILPYLTLQNLQAYLKPESSLATFKKSRSNLEKLAAENNAQLFGDIAYNYAPFVSDIFTLYPTSKIIFIYRDGREFVQSAYTDMTPDPTPVGWPDSGKKLTKLERYIALGRLRPRESDEIFQRWSSLHPVEKNAWLWATTNTIVMDQLKKLPKELVIDIKFEELVSNPHDVYKSLRTFLGLSTPIPESVLKKLEKKVNSRAKYLIPHHTKWDSGTACMFNRQAALVMERLGYY